MCLPPHAHTHVAVDPERDPGEDLPGRGLRCDVRRSQPEGVA